MKTEIEERQYKRFVVLYALYKETKGNTQKVINLKELANKEGIKNGVFEEAYSYLKAEGFINSGNPITVGISHEGVKAVEESVKFPEKTMLLFPSFKDMGL